MNEALLKLQTKPEKNVLADIKSQEEEINQALQLRNTKISAIKAEQTAGLITVSQERIQIAGINDEYAKTIQQAKDLIVFIQTTNTLNEDQRKALDGTVSKLKIIVATAKDLPKALLSAATVADDIASGLTNVGAALAKGVTGGHGLAHAFTSAWKAFKAFASDFLLKIGEMILKQSILNALGGGGNGQVGGIAKGIGSFVSGLFAPAAGAAAGAAGSAATSAATSGAVDEAVAFMFHTGGHVGSGGQGRSVAASVFNNARRMHTGGVVGLKPNELPIIAEKGEQVLTRQQQTQRGTGQQAQHIQVINGIDHEDIVRKGLGAPSNTRVILNMIRANKGAVNQALA